MTISQSAITSYLVNTGDNWNGVSFDWTQSVTINASDNVLVVRLAGGVASATTITYGGQSLTRRIGASDGGSGNVDIFDLVAPPSGTHSLVIDSAQGARIFRVFVSTLSGVNTTTPIVDMSSDDGYKSTLSSTLTSVDGGLVLDVIGIKDSHTATVGADQTETATAESSVSGYIAYASNEVANSDSTIMSWGTVGGDERVSQAAVSYNPDTASATGPTRQVIINTTGYIPDGTNTLEVVL